MLTIIEAHPVQYHAPVYRCLAQDFDIPVTVIYGSDFSIAGYKDDEFGASFAWDTDLLGGYESIFLSRVESGGASRFDQVSADGLNEALKKSDPSVVMSLGYAFPFDRAGVFSVLRNRWPLFFRGETTDHALARSKLKQLVRDTVLRGLYKRCAALLYVGKRSREHYERLGVDPRKLYASPYCVDSNTFDPAPEDRARMRPETRAELGIDDHRNVILYSGKLSHRKGVDLAVEAVKRLPRELRDNTTLLFLGDGAKREELEALSRAEPAIDARFLGFQNQTQLSRFYHASDILTLPSRFSETWGLVVNEGLIHGLPCVVSDGVGSHPDLIASGATGEVFDTADIATYTRAIERCLEYARDEATARHCREKVADYSIHKAAEGIAKACEDLRS